MVGGIDVDADGRPARPGQDDREEGPHSFGEHHRGATVQQTVRLGVARDRHGGHRTGQRDLGEGDAHPLVQGADGHRVDLLDRDPRRLGGGILRGGGPVGHGP